MKEVEISETKQGTLKKMS